MCPGNWGKPTTSLQLVEGDVEATQPSEEVDEAEGLTTSSHHFGPVRPRLIERDFSWFVQILILCHFLLCSETRQGHGGSCSEKLL